MRRIRISVAVLAAVVLALAACSAPAPKPAVSESTEISAPEDPAVQPESVVKHALYFKLSAQKKAQIDRQAALSLDEFYAQPLLDQLTYAKFVRDNNGLITKYRLTKNAGAAYKKLLDKAVAPAVSNTAEQVIIQDQANGEIAFTLVPKGKPLDKVNAQKMTVLNAAEGSSVFRAVNAALEKGNGGLRTPVSPKVSAEHKGTVGGAPAIIYNTVLNGVTSQTTKKLIRFADIDGRSVLTWQTFRRVKSGDPGFNTSLK